MNQWPAERGMAPDDTPMGVHAKREVDLLALALAPLDGVEVLRLGGEDLLDGSPRVG